MGYGFPPETLLGQTLERLVQALPDRYRVDRELGAGHGYGLADLGRRSVALVVLLAALVPMGLEAQQRLLISGRVSTVVGVPISGANVFIDGTTISGVTGTDGTYRILVPPDGVAGQTVTLVARSIGYQMRSEPVTLGANVAQDFELAANPFHLGELVVTGSGTTTIAEKLGNIVDIVRGSDLVRSNEQNVVNALAAKAPNVLVVSESGDPGASSSIHIRGLRTITGTGQPLFVVDGMPVDNATTPTTSDLIRNTSNPNRASDLNPDDIESITVLKGAAAGALYGARAGQGVILITTRHAAAAGTHVTFRSSGSNDWVSASYPLQRKYGQGTGWISSACSAPNCVAGQVSFGPELAPGRPTYDHSAELFGDGSQGSQSLSVTSGSDRDRLFLSASRFDQTGIFGGPNNRYRRYTGRLNESHQFTDRLSVGANVSVASTDGGFLMRGSNLSSVIISALRTPPGFNNLPYLDPVSGLQRSARFPMPAAGSETSSRGTDNPFFVIHEQDNSQGTTRAFGNLVADWAPLTWLSVKYTLGSDVESETRHQALPQSSAAFPGGQVTSFKFNRSQIDHNLVATASYTLNRNVGGTVVAGQNLNAREYEQEFVQGNTLLAAQPFRLSNTLQQVSSSDAGTLIHTEGYFVQATADLFGELYLAGAVRYDGSSTFSDNSRRNWFPKASAAWTFGNHLGRSGLAGLITYGKLRMAYGQVGQEPDPYQLISTLIAGGAFCDPIYGCTVSQNATQGTAGALFSSLLKGQAGIRPERSTEFEAGIDLGLLGDRVDAAATWYNALSRDVLFAAPVATSTGYSTQVQNAGRIRNSGFELSLNIRAVNEPNLGWTLGLQWARNDNRVLSLGGAQFVPMVGGVNGFAFGAAVLGGRVGSVMGNDFVRCGVPDVAPEAGHGMTLVDVQTACAGRSTGALVVAANGFPIPDLTTRQIVDPQPQWTAGITNTVRYRRVRFTAFLDIRHGGQVLNGTKATLYGIGTHLDTESAREGTRIFGETWMAGQATAGPGAGKAVYLVCPAAQPACGTPGGNWFSGNGGGFGSVLSQFAENAGFVKLREVSMGYALDAPWVRRVLGITSLDFTVAGRNLFTATRYSGWNPETSLTGAVTAVSGVDLQDTPQTRSLVFTVALSW